MDINTLRGIATIFAMVAFIGIVVWAYSSYKKKDFDEAAQLPFADDDEDQKTREQQDTGSNEK
ncbi:CcoQ/FixQ family Cbb3-type cytochrome c oxidase assembly chaperone [Pseudomonas sp. G11-1]|uniref:CcoQ/FixQ family Cbb3-type cytochrome c oxidase assembly chaperone n=1 Tax=Halopseudomonas bauzanensis TaxID=653930 RepID=A0A031M1Z2_9GAMM|nr:MULTISPECIES: CcoQ/FixQ family Cbb3-type cytochrome c oxidase assembly chaperone [Halopseudomonas]MCO5784867.1 CcoQ/FixQ family Cbb3-type cytochrome c oxidase assembly chaperone [Pseudomonas sp. G11-1]MCO5789030.1 CcoQ/FixQ family Cbb3-type cytochrome c oxidase assembly chaperone [Pseudomonas sp. G11-2]EZQ14020.1 cytochrome oxidase [Halopseudomonas bauzanensis]TKA90936.1 CcoQ/FixQ family Cbb3-type cytochrome c oxidase assembly chaperone [Halopseudomonas bauzanensis]WGK60425.1 CcoQ/FixQ fami